MFGIDTIAYIALAISAISAMASAYSSYSQAQAQNKQNQYYSEVADRNAARSKWEAQQAKDLAEEQAEKHDKKVRILLSQNTARQGASGLALTGGTSFAAVQEDVATQGKADEMAILYQGDIEAWNAMQNADTYSGQAALYNMNQQSPLLAGGGALLTGFGNLGLQAYSTYKMSKGA